MKYSKRYTAAARMAMHNIAATVEDATDYECEYDERAHVFWLGDMAVQVDDMLYIVDNDVPIEAVFHYADYTGTANFQSWHKLFYAASLN